MATADFEVFYERSVDAVYRYASRLTGGDRVRTDELVQETYLAVLRVDVDAEPTASYLITACRHRFLDQLRSEQRRRTREQRAAVPAEVSAIDPAEIQTGPAVAALATLSDEHRAALVLRYVDDLPVRDVAVTLDAACVPPSRCWCVPASPYEPPTGKETDHDRDDRP